MSHPHRVKSSSASTSSASASSPWSSSDASTAARSDRQAQLNRLLLALERKQHGSTSNGASDASTEEKEKERENGNGKSQHQTNNNNGTNSNNNGKSRRTSSSSSSRRHSLTRRSSTGLQNGVAAPSSSARFASTTSPPSSSSSTVDPSSLAYRSQLLESRGIRSAHAQSTAGERAIERGATILAAQSNATFAIASASTMADRAAARAARRAEYLEAQQRAAAEREIIAQEQARREAEAVDQVKRAEALQRRQVKQLEASQSQAKQRAKEIESQKLILASMHAQRSVMIYSGWLPWLKLIEQRRLRDRTMMQQGVKSRLTFYIMKWCAGVRVVKKQREELMEKKYAKAVRYSNRKQLRRFIRQWARVLFKRRKEIESHRIGYQKRLTKRTFISLKLACFELRESRRKKVARLEQNIDALARRCLLRHVLSSWRATSEKQRVEKKSLKKVQDVKSRVGGWLEEFRAQRAKERGEDVDTTDLSSSQTAPITTSTMVAVATLSTPSSTMSVLERIRADLPSSHRANSITSPPSTFTFDASSPSHASAAPLLSSLRSPVHSVTLKSPRSTTLALSPRLSTLLAAESSTAYSPSAVSVASTTRPITSSRTVTSSRPASSRIHRERSYEHEEDNLNLASELNSYRSDMSIDSLASSSLTSARTWSKQYQQLQTQVEGTRHQNGMRSKH